MITDAVREYLQAITVPLRLSCVTPSGWPMVLSLWYLFKDDRLFCATQRSARVVRYLHLEPRCAFEIASEHPPYCGVRGQGKAGIDEELGQEILATLLKRYLGGTDNPLARRLMAHSQNEVAIVIEPVNLFKWNFTDRMKDSITIDANRPCPD